MKRWKRTEQILNPLRKSKRSSTTFSSKIMATLKNPESITEIKTKVEKMAA